jgi:hypothetical protein
MLTKTGPSLVRFVVVYPHRRCRRGSSRHGRAGCGHGTNGRQYLRRTGITVAVIVVSDITIRLGARSRRRHYRLQLQTIETLSSMRICHDSTNHESSGGVWR